MEGRFLRALIRTSQGCRKAEQLPRTGPFGSIALVSHLPHSIPKQVLGWALINMKNSRPLLGTKTLGRAGTLQEPRSKMPGSNRAATGGVGSSDEMSHCSE